jgi:hypothetical protein
VTKQTNQRPRLLPALRCSAPCQLLGNRSVTATVHRQQQPDSSTYASLLGLVAILHIVNILCAVLLMVSSLLIYRRACHAQPYHGIIVYCPVVVGISLSLLGAALRTLCS